MVDNRAMPWDKEAEKAVLSAMVNSEDARALAVEKLSYDSFFYAAHKTVFRAVFDLFQRNDGVDAVTLSSELKTNNSLDAVGGFKFLAELVDFTGTENIQTYIDVVHEKYMARQVIETCHSAISSAHSAKSGEIKGILDKTEGALFDVSQTREHGELIPARDLVWEVLGLIDARKRNAPGSMGVPTGFAQLDRLVAGFRPGQLVIIAGRPGMGKTSLALNVVLNATLSSDVGSMLFSLEMSKEEIVERMLSMQGGIDSKRLRVGEMTARDDTRIAEAAGLVKQTNILIDDTGVLTPLEILTKARRAIMKDQNLKLLVVDYIQLLDSTDTQRRSRVQEISEITRALKAMAKDLHVPVVALSQLSRATEHREDPRPQLSDLRESGSIEQDADTVMFIFREELYRGKRNAKGEDIEGVAEILVRKQRNGPTGKVTLRFDAEHTNFVDVKPEIARTPGW
jgi:replicative DNA helicase